MKGQKYEMLFWQGKPPSDGGHPGFNPRTEKSKGMLIEHDIAVAMRDDVKIYVDVFRPQNDGKYPVLICWSPFGKHGRVYPPSADVRHDLSEYTGFEAADPVYWCANEYVIINADPRGAWYSEGDLTFMTDQEAEDCVELIEWAGTQEWSNGKVGMSGVSYLTMIQWRVAALNPPHLAAINPWEGVSDLYRELYFHGGIRETVFSTRIRDLGFRCTTTRVEDYVGMALRHPLFDDYWASKNADLSKITVPAFIVASWSDHALHTRGTIEGFKKIASKEKWLMVHGRKKWNTFHEQESLEKQRQFFDRFLKGIDSEVKNWPKVMLEIRRRYGAGNFRCENEWPLARTRYTKLFLNARDGKMGNAPFKEETQVAYSASDYGDKTQNACFEYDFDERTELTGYMKLRLWVEAIGADDMDFFVAIDKIDRSGKTVPFAFCWTHEDGPVALGWLRVSHRELDEKKSMPYQPFHKHQREIKLKAGEIVPAEIEIWPSSTLFEMGEKLRVKVQGSDIGMYWGQVATYGHLDTVNRGQHVIHTGGKHDSHLLVPVIPTG
jgi:predicted acyl esterase